MAERKYTVIIRMVIISGVSVQSTESVAEHVHTVIIIMLISGGVSVQSNYHYLGQW